MMISRRCAGATRPRQSRRTSSACVDGGDERVGPVLYYLYRFALVQWSISPPGTLDYRLWVSGEMTAPRQAFKVTAPIKPAIGLPA